MLRDATLDDIPRLVELGHGMHFESPRYSRLAYSPDKVAAQFRQLILGDHGFVMVAERGGVIVGGLAAFAVPHWCSPDLVATDLGLFIAPSARGGGHAPMLVERYVRWARERGAVLIQLGISTGVHVDVTEKLFERLGLRRFGSLWEVVDVHGD